MGAIVLDGVRVVVLASGVPHATRLEVRMTGSSPLAALVAALADGSVEVVDLTSPLSASTPVIQLPPEFGQTATFALEEISR